MTIAVPEGLETNIRFNTASGDVEFDNTEVTIRHDQKYITKSATIGDASTSIMLETSSGNASIKE
ncbi:MAG: putative lipoprotein NlpE involved in copper resistance [Enterobacterales bacterium]|jgi:uncharacterized lipoprotein NlpE involved in copper resistance